MRYKKLIIGILLMMVAQSNFAGNPDRSGSAGATEVLINPWAKSSGFADANSASIMGLEAQALNVAGLAFTRKTELAFSRTEWLKGSEIGINNFGFSQRVGESGVFGASVMSMGFGDIQRTTVELPEGGLGDFSISYINAGLSYAREFSNSIYGGLTAKVITESISDVVAAGFAFDAGIQYKTRIGKKIKRDNFRFGIALRNVGPPMKFDGDGLSFRQIVSANNVEMTVAQKSARYEIPSQVNIGGTYDLFFGELKSDSVKKEPMHRVSLATTYTSNSFTEDQYRFGIEYGFKSYLSLRAGYIVENKNVTYDTNISAHTGLTAGFSIDIPLSKLKGAVLGIDYSYRDTDPFQGTHCIGARIML